MLFADDEVERTVEFLKQDKVVVYPTDTIWGLGCDAVSEKAVDRVFEIKGRPKSKSLIVLLSDVEQLFEYVEDFCPAAVDVIRSSDMPLSVIFPKSKSLAKGISDDGSVCVRVTGNAFCKAVINRLGHPVTSTSANISGEPSPASFADISHEIIARADYVVGFGHEDKTAARPSRIIRMNADGTYEIVRC